MLAGWLGMWSTRTPEEVEQEAEDGMRAGLCAVHTHSRGCDPSILAWNLLCLLYTYPWKMTEPREYESPVDLEGPLSGHTVGVKVP